MILANRQQRRKLAAENRSQPIELRSVPASEWSHINKGCTALRIEVWRSREFLVQVFEEQDGLERLTVNRCSVTGEEWDAEISWDELQRIKRECGRGNRDAVEIYPSDADLVNVANMRHLWVMAEEIPFKWKTKR